MSIHKITFIVLCTILFNACTNDLFIVHNGSMPAQEEIQKIHNGQTKEDVLLILGSPSAKTGLSDDHWIYMESTMKEIAFLNPKELDRQILTIDFENNKIYKIQKLTLNNGKNISIDKNITKSVDSGQGFFQKYFGGVGTYNPIASASNKGSN